MKIFLITLGVCLYALIIGISYVATNVFRNPKEKISPIATLFGIVLWPIGIVITLITSRGSKK